ncbi:MAG: DUF1018 domain-containing protein [Eubacteriales bacterium]|nr:DUF1018 domain-containing protein [Eubacteriales bacterium]
MIYALARKADIDNELLHDNVKRITGCDSIKALSMTQAKAIINRLQECTGDKPRAAPMDRATNAQRGMIFALSRELGWGGDSPRLTAFLEKRFGVSSVAFLTTRQTGPVIEAMKSMRDGGRGERRKTDE